MIGFAVRRVLLAIPVLLAVLTIAFWATVSVPGDPLAALLPDNPTPEQYERIAEEWGMDGPLVEQWARYIVRTLEGDLGRSLRTRQPVVEDLQKATIASLELALVAFAITCVLGVVAGVVSAVYEGRAPDHFIGVVLITATAAPIFWSALMLQLLFYARLDWLPPGGRIEDLTLILDPFPTVTGLFLVDSLAAGRPEVFVDVLRHLALPAFVMSLRASGLVARVTRAAMIDALRAPYTETARAFGAAESKIVTLHAFRNAMLPVVTVLGLAFGELLAGSILIETVFNWPGLGLYTVQSIIGLDYSGVVGASLFITVIYVFANLVVDLLYPLVDPRLREHRR